MLKWLILLCVSVSAFADTGAPKLTADKIVYDFGKVNGVESVAGKFTLRNEGNAILKFGEPRVSCGCTVANIKPESIAPGQSAELEFTLNMPAAQAKLNKEITVLSNDPKTPELTLSLLADFTPAYQMSPAVFNINIREGGATNLNFRLTRTDGRKIEVEKIETSNAWIESEIRRKETNSVEIALKVSPPGGPRRLSELVRVFSPETNAPIALLQILGRVVGDVVIDPASLFWNVTNPLQLTNETFAARKLIVSASSPGREINVQRATSSVPEVKVTFKKAGGSYQVVCKLERIPSTTVLGKVVVETDSPKQPSVEVPFTIFVSQALSAQLSSGSAAAK